MRTAITIGITEDGKAEIISHPSTPLHEQRRAFNSLAGKKSKFVETQLWESGRGMTRRNRPARTAEDGGVNFNAAHPVDKQRAKGKNKLPDLTPTSGGTGGVDFNSAHPVDKQQDKKAAKNLRDLNAAFDEGATGKKSGVDFSSALPFEEQGKAGGHKHAKKSAAKTSSAKAEGRKGRAKGRAARQPDKTAKADLASKDEGGQPGDEDPKL